MVLIKSERAKKWLTDPVAWVAPDPSQMRRYPADDLPIWVKVERENQNVKNLSFAGDVQDYEKVLLQALAALLKGRPLTLLDQLSLRECEAFLRDRNSELALEGLQPVDEAKFKKFFSWLRILPVEAPAREYEFSSQKGAFGKLKLVEKVREIKAFLNSPEVRELYKNGLQPELVDVDGLTVYIQVPYHSERDRALFEELHIIGVSTFQEEQLNFIPEA